MNAYTALLASALALGLGSQAFAMDVEIQSDDGPPTRVHHAQSHLIIRQRVFTKPIQLGLTPLDRGKGPINCASAAGCLVTAKVYFTVSGYRFARSVSAYVDGVAMDPVPSPAGTEVSSQQSAIIPQGVHTLQSQVSQQVPGDNITGWNIEYAIYDLN